MFKRHYQKYILPQMEIITMTSKILNLIELLKMQECKYFNNKRIANWQNEILHLLDIEECLMAKNVSLQK